MAKDLDCSWIDTEEKMNLIDKNYIREPIHSIQMFFVYINTLSEIEFVSKELEHVDAQITKERLLQIIQMKRHHNHKKYRLDDILSFQIDLEPENIQSFSELENVKEISSTFLKSIPIFDEVVCLPSIFIFHDIQGLFFLFNETEIPQKSILKTGDHRRTIKKNVRIVDSPSLSVNSVDPCYRKSVKKFMRKMKHTRKAFS
jgi:hypothetical protein